VNETKARTHRVGSRGRPITTQRHDGRCVKHVLSGRMDRRGRRHRRRGVPVLRLFPLTEQLDYKCNDAIVRCARG